MALSDITRADVGAAMEEFDAKPLEELLKTHGGGTSTRWYVAETQRRYDQKLILRIAHHLSGRGPLQSFKANEAKRHLERLDFNVVD